MHTCNYGCGQEASYYFKSGDKWCCSKSVNTCKAMREKNSASNKGRNKGRPKFFKNGHPRGMLGKKSWNSGLKISDYPEEIRELVRQSSIKGGLNSSGKGATPEKEAARRQKISKRLKEVGGGYRPGSGRGKSGRYMGYWCDSSWELAWVIYSIEHAVSFKKNNKKFQYIFEGETRSYTPDFELDNGDFVEIKGYMTPQVEAKIAWFPQDKKLIILDKYSIQPILNYVVQKYGKKFIELYDKSLNESEMVP